MVDSGNDNRSLQFDIGGHVIERSSERQRDWLVVRELREILNSVIVIWYALFRNDLIT